MANVSHSAVPPRRSHMLAGIVSWGAWSHLLLVVVITLVLRIIGEHWWLTGMALYGPRALLLVPCLVFALLLCMLGRTRLLWTQLAAALIVWFPLMGFVLPSTSQSAPAASDKVLTVMSYNIHMCLAGEEAIADRVAQYAPDVVMLQELCDDDPSKLVARLRQQYPVVHTEDQFLIATRFPLLNVETGKKFERLSRIHTERFMRYELQTPLGRMAFYSLHPLSPRWAFYSIRDIHPRASLRSGTLIRGGGAEERLADNFAVRDRQLSAVSARAAQDVKDHIPHVLGGDTNLPGLSRWVPKYFGAYSDGFESVGWGFGYTFPSRLPIMRLDRFFASPELRFLDFRIGCERTSDHQCVVTKLTNSQ